MRFTELFTGLFVFAIVATSFGWALIHTASLYSIDAEDFSDPYNKIANTSVLATDIQDTLLQKGGGGGGSSTEDSETNIIRGAWDVLKLVPQSFNYVNSLLNVMVTTFKAPPFIKEAIYSLIIVAIAFAAISAVFKYRL